jgi:hypothetical protein
MREKTCCVAALVIGGLPVTVYPFVFLTALMGLAGWREGTEITLSFALTLTLLFGALAYPLIYFPLTVGSVWALVKGREKTAFSLALCPLIYLFLLMMILTAMLCLGVK